MESCQNFTPVVSYSRPTDFHRMFFVEVALDAAENENNKERTNNKTSHKYPASPPP